MLQLVIEVFISCYINLEELKGKSEKGSFKVWSHRQDLFSIHWFTPALRIVQFNCMLYPISSMLGRCQHNFPSHMHVESPQKNMAFFQYLEESCIIVLISKEKIGLVTNSSTTRLMFYLQYARLRFDRTYQMDEAKNVGTTVANRFFGKPIMKTKSRNPHDWAHIVMGGPGPGWIWVDDWWWLAF